MKTVAIVQARMASTRLPGKILLPMGRDCSLGYVTHRLSKVKGLQDIIVATTTQLSDDIIEAFCKKRNIHSFRGDSKDVLSRYYEAASKFSAECVVRVTSDCPLLDFELLDDMLEKFRSFSNVDYFSNCMQRTFPRGLDIEIFSYSALSEAYNKARKAYEREHVTPFLYECGRFKVKSYMNEIDLSHHRWTLDTFEDYCLLCEITERLTDMNFNTKDVLSILNEIPSLLDINRYIEQKALTETE